VLSLNTLDDAGLDILFAPDAAVLTASSGQFDGPAGFEAFRQALHDGFPDVFHTVREVVAEGDTAYARWTASGTNAGDWRGAPASGEPRSWTGISRIVARCGQIVEALDQVDQLALDGRAPADSSTYAPASDTPAACRATDPERIRAATERLWAEGWNGGDVQVYRELANAGIVHHWTSGPDTVGEDASAARLETFFANVPDLTIAWDHLVVDGDLVAAGWRLTGTVQGEMMGTPVTGAAIDYTGFNVYRFACGEIVEAWSEGDIPALQAQLAAAGG